MEEEYITVTQLTSYIDKKFKMDPKLKNIYVKGEISNYKTYSSGHSYFTLKDKKSQISGVLFKGQKKFLKFEPKDGMKVIIKGSVIVYEKDGKYQLRAARITEDGLGDLHVAFEQLKEKLKKEGLFDEKYKKEIPKFPQRIGVVTAQTGAAIRDIITTIKRRWKNCAILIFSTLVQGEKAAAQIVKQIKRAEKFNLDTLIVGRGGGSIEDLWPFNEEIVARAIFECKTPVISAVGHEIDFTISDFVADLRAATPTAAAEIAVPNFKDIDYQVTQINNRANNAISDKIKINKDRMKNICEKQILKNPESIYEIKEMELDQLINKLNYTSKNIITQNKNKLTLISQKQIFKNPETIYDKKEIKLHNLINKLNYTSKNIITQNKNKLNLIKNSSVLKNPTMIYSKKEEKIIANTEKLEILNPLLTLKRGYTLAKVNDKVISSVKDVKKDDEIEVEFKDGKINTKVI